jgi:peptidyl-prolyl cis-trans isomerase D
LVILAFVGGFIVTDVFRGESRSKDDLVYIGDATINVAEFQKQLLAMLRNYKEQLKENFDRQMISRYNIPENVLQQLINTSIMRIEAKKLSIIASTGELKDKIIHYPGFQRDGKFIGIEAYELMLAHNRMDVIEFENDLKEQIVMEKLRNVVSSGLVVDKATLQEQYKKEKDKADLEYILLRPETVKDPITVTDSEVDSYYQDHKENFKSPERRAGSVVFLKSQDYKKEITLTDKDMRDFFKTNISQYAEQGKTKVSRIFLKYDDKNRDEIYKKTDALQKELSKDNFAAKSKEVSDDDKAKEGGDYGYFEWQDFTKQEKTFIDTLNQDEISTPIDTGAGFALLFIAEKTEAKQQEFDKVKPFIQSSLEREKLDQLMENKINDIYQKLRKETNIKEKAVKLGYKVIETGLVFSREGIKGVDEQGYITQHMFGLKEKQVGVPVRTQGGVAIVQLLQVQKPELEPLEKIREKVKDEALRGKKIQRLMLEGRTVTADLNGMKDDKAIEKYMKDKSLAAETAPYTRGNKLGPLPVKKGLDNFIFSQPENRYSDPIDLKEAVALVKLTGKTITGPAEFEKEKEKYYTQKLAEMQNNYFGSYISNKREVYNVQINQELFQATKDYIIQRFN